MLKKRILTLLIFILLLLSSTIVNAKEAYVDTSKLDNGVVKVNYRSDKNVPIAVRISKDNVNYDYILNGNNTLPLQLGDGEYSVYILENIGGNKFKQVISETVTLKLENQNEVYLQSIQMIRWNNNMNAVKKARELTKGSKNDKEKVEAIYEYIVDNISYDNYKLRKICSNYIPTIDEILKSQKGICYDYAALFAAMLRSVDVPTKLVMGTKNDIKGYHAWNQVYLKDTSEWITIDTTYDAGMKASKARLAIIKDAEMYKISKEY